MCAKPNEKIPAIHNGWIAFLDILGYKALLEQNDLHEAYDIIKNNLISAHKNALSWVAYRSKMSGLDQEEWNPLNKIKLCQFSDSFIIGLPLEDEPYFAESMTSLYFAYLGILQRLLLESGLPLRGAISFGEFIMNDGICCGKCLVDAHEYSNKIDMAVMASILMIVLNQKSKRQQHFLKRQSIWCEDIEMELIER